MWAILALHRYFSIVEGGAAGANFKANVFFDRKFLGGRRYKGIDATTTKTHLSMQEVHDAMLADDDVDISALDNDEGAGASERRPEKQLVIQKVRFALSPLFLY